MRMIVDTREQKPLDIRPGGTISEVRVEALPFGDYGAEWETGKQMPVVIERKSIPDLWGTMTTGYDRFKREMERAREAKFKMVLVIEGSLMDVYDGFERSAFKGDSMVKKLFTMWVKYDLVPVFCTDRREMKRFVIETFEAVGRNFSGEVEDGEKQGGA